jgi:multimeric flavodoxin WrbA
MNFVILNGSPKGDKSVTLQYIKYIQKIYPKHELEVINISQQIRKIENNDNYLKFVLDKIRKSHAVVWATPVYFLLVPANYKRFVELIFEKKLEYIFQEKYTAVITTSIHYFDHTAHNYLRAICDDLKMKFIGSYSADMYDLLKKEERKRFEIFVDNLLKEIESNSSPQICFEPIQYKNFKYEPGNHSEKYDLGKKNLLILTDSIGRQTNIHKMIQQFSSMLSGNVEIININEIAINGYCLGCVNCAYDNQCVYKDKDEYVNLFLNKVMKADILIFAGTIKDRYLSSRWKLFFDRSFFRGHVQSFSGKQIGIVISGPLRQVPNLRQILEAYFEIQNANLIDIITDEIGDSSQIDDKIISFSKRMINHANSMFIGSPTFFSIAGRKLFRDEIWGRLRFPFRADYVEYRKKGRFDFPQANWKSRIHNMIMLSLSKSQKFRSEINKKTIDKMIEPFEKIL